MSVTVEHLGPCKKLLRVEVEAEVVKAEFAKASVEVGRRARLPGFRPGKVPAAVLQRTFGDRIREEVKHKLLKESYEAALKEHNFRAVTQPKIEEVQFAPDQPFIYTAGLEIAPQFELPEYKGLPIRRELRVVTEEDQERALNVLRDQRGTFTDVDRPVQMGDFVVVNYSGACEGRPITDLVPTARGLTHQTNFWMRVQTEHFVPGFTDQLIGASRGQKRTVTVTFPSDFVVPQLVGKVGVFEVEIVQVKEKHLPPLDDAFAKTYQAESLEKLREGVRKDLENELKSKLKSETRNQLVGTLLGRVNLELPESLVDEETRGAVYDIVKANAERGVSREVMDERKNQIYGAASHSARERLKIMFLLGRIAEKENIRITNDELSQQVVYMALQRKVKPDKLIKEMQESGDLNGLHQQMLNAKVLDFLELHAQVEEVPARS